MNMIVAFSPIAPTECAVLNGGTTVVSGTRSVDVGTTPRATIGYRLIDADHLIYSSAAKVLRPGGANLYDSSSSLCTSDLRRLGLARIAEIFQPDSLGPYEATTLAPVTYANGVSGEIPDQTPVPTLHPRTIGLSARATY